MRFITGFFLCLVVGSTHAVVVDTYTPTTDGTSTSTFILQQNGSAQSFTVDAVDTFLDDLTLYFSTDAISASNATQFTFRLASSLTASSGIISDIDFSIDNVGVATFDLDLDLSSLAGSTIYAMVDHNGYAGNAALVALSDVYAGGNLVVFASDDFGSPSEFTQFDQAVIANFTSGPTVANPSQVPEPGTIALIGLGLAGFSLSRRKR